MHSQTYGWMQGQTIEEKIKKNKFKQSQLEKYTGIDHHDYE